MNASAPPMTTNRAAGRREQASAAASTKSSTRFLASRRPTQPTSTVSLAAVKLGPEPRPAGGIEFGKVDHRRDLDRVMPAVPELRGGGFADGTADADIAAGEVLGAGQRLRHQPAVLDQRRTRAKPLQRRIDVGHVLACDDQIVARDLGGQVGHGCVEAETIGRRVDVDAQGCQLAMALRGHARLVEADDDVDPVAARIEVLGEQAHFRLLAAHHQPGKHEEHPNRAGRCRSHCIRTAERSG